MNALSEKHLVACAETLESMDLTMDDFSPEDIEAALGVVRALADGKTFLQAGGVHSFYTRQGYAVACYVDVVTEDYGRPETSYTLADFSDLDSPDLTKSWEVVFAMALAGGLR